MDTEDQKCAGLDQCLAAALAADKVADMAVAAEPAADIEALVAAVDMLEVEQILAAESE